MTSSKPEIWKVIPSHPTHEVSSLGRVRRAVQSRNWVAGKILATRKNKRGYSKVSINDKYYLLHQLVCEAFNGPRSGAPLCRHLDDNKDNNCPENLAWGTSKQNIADGIRNGKMPQLEPRFDRSEASRLYQMGLNVREIGYFLGVSHVAIVLGLKGTEYRSLPRQTPLDSQYM